MLPEFSLLLNDPQNIVVVDFETSLIDQHGNVEYIWLIGWAWLDEKGDVRYEQVWWEGGITIESLASLLIGARSRAVVKERPVDIKLTRLLNIVQEKHPVFHNAQFEKRLFDALNVPITRYHDTMLMAYMCVPPTVMSLYPQEDNSKLYSLRELGKRGFCTKKEDSPDFTEWDEALIKYNLADLEAELSLFQGLSPQLFNDEQLLYAYINIGLPSTEMCMMMTRTGVYITDENIDLLMLEADDIIDKCQKTIRAELPCVVSPSKPQLTKKKKDPKFVAGSGRTFIPKRSDLDKFVYLGQIKGEYAYAPVVEFNPNSPNHMVYVLDTVLNWESPYKTKTGKPKTDKHALGKLLEDMPDNKFVKALMEYKKYEKLRTVYYRRWKTDRDENSRIHPSFLVTNTLTGRLSSRNPNFQNISASIKNAITAAPGYDLICIDLSQAELRLLAYYLAVVCDDYTLWNRYAAKEDVHDYNRRLLGLQPHERKIAKTAIFCDIYGGGPSTFAKQANISVSRAKEIMGLFHSRMPGIPTLKEATKATISSTKDGVLRTLLGRKIVYPAFKKKGSGSGYDAEKERAFRQYFNALFQGGNYDITTVLAWSVLPECLQCGGRPILQVHDEMVFEVPESSSGWFADVLMEKFNRSDLLEGLMIEATPGIGRSWEAAKNDGEKREKGN